MNKRQWKKIFVIGPSEDYDDDESTYLHSAVASDVTFCGQPD